MGVNYFRYFLFLFDKSRYFFVTIRLKKKKKNFVFFLMKCSYFICLFLFLFC